jgi:hypothetical protein
MQTCLLSEQYVAPLSEGCRTPAVHDMQPEVTRQRADHKYLVGYAVLQLTKGGSMLQPHKCWIVVHSCSKTSLVPSFRGRRLHRLKPYPQSWPGCLRWGRGAVLGVPCLQTLCNACRCCKSAFRASDWRCVAIAIDQVAHHTEQTAAGTTTTENRCCPHGSSLILQLAHAQHAATCIKVCTMLCAAHKQCRLGKRMT